MTQRLNWSEKNLGVIGTLINKHLSSCDCDHSSCLHSTVLANYAKTNAGTYTVVCSSCHHINLQCGNFRLFFVVVISDPVVDATSYHICYITVRMLITDTRLLTSWCS